MRVMSEWHTQKAKPYFSKKCERLWSMGCMMRTYFRGNWRSQGGVRRYDKKCPLPSNLSPLTSHLIGAPDSGRAEAQVASMLTKGQQSMRSCCRTRGVCPASCERSYEGICFMYGRLLLGDKAKADVRRYSFFGN